MHIVSVGEVLWDVFAEREFLGGAPLNVCANLKRCGDEPILISAVGEDARGRLTLDSMTALGLDTSFVQAVSHRATGVAIVGKTAAGEPAFSIPRPAAFDAVVLSPEIMAQLEGFAPAWLYMGTLMQVEPAMEKMIASLIGQLPEAKVFYDMNLRTGHWNLPLVERLCTIAHTLKLNEDEAETLDVLSGTAREAFSLDTFCPKWAQRFGIDVVLVTLGPAGCLIYADRTIKRFPGCPVKVADTVGAGDAFAAAFLHGYQSGWPLARAASFANALGGLVASRNGATPEWRMEEVLQLARASDCSMS